MLRAGEGHEGLRRESLLPSFMSQFAKLVVLWLLRAYKWAISPMFPPSCRYVPTCSEYAMEAVERYGARRGGLMAAWRLLRCHPFAHGGYDPVTKGTAGFTQGLEPFDLADDSTQRLKRCATQNPNTTKNPNGGQVDPAPSNLNGAALTQGVH